MAAKNRKKNSALSASTFLCAAVFSFLVASPFSAVAQELDGDSKLYLTSDTLIYDQDNDRILVNGGVQIFYDGYKLVAERVVYDQTSGRMVATGNVEMVEPGGNRVYADTLDITDDFSNGFLNALRVETPDDTHIVAESAQRINSTVMVLNNGVYTACEPCAENPEKAPFWQVKARKIVQNEEDHTITMESSRFELLGIPIAYIPYLKVPDHTVKRKSGFLAPTSSYVDTFGYGVTVPYFLVLSPSSDVTFSPTYYSTGGLVMDAEYRKRFKSGKVTLRLGGMKQPDPTIFGAGTSDRNATYRGLVHSTGVFKINPRWTFGWDVLAQSDNNFAYTYKFSKLNSSVYQNKVYLTGLGQRNNFDLHSFYFDVQDGDPTNAAERQQASVPAVLDYEYYAPEPVAGGQLSAKVNLTNIYRGKYDATAVTGSDRFHGLPGWSSRLSTELEWKRTFNQDGLLLTPIVAARADGHLLNATNPNSLSGTLAYGGNYYTGNTAARGMVTAGLEARYPILFSAEGSTHILEPIAQIFVRPDEPLAGGLPNEDAQSFVFDATSLFERDKFSGFDRIEGGTRANVGLRYTGSFDNGIKLHGVFGQSYHIAGMNSFATSDLVNAGANSGLETKVSDFVGLIGVSNLAGVTASSNGRFDKSSFALKRLDTNLTYSNTKLSAGLTYTEIAAQPSYGIANKNRELRANGNVKLFGDWSLNGAINWDIDALTVRGHSIGLAYADECTTFTLNFARSDDSSASNWAVTARLNFRTIGYLQTQTTLDSQ